MKQIRIEVFPLGSRLRPGDCGLKKPDIPYAMYAAGGIDEAAVNEKDLLRREIFHFFASALRAGSYHEIKSFTCETNAGSIPFGYFFLHAGSMMMRPPFLSRLMSTSDPTERCSSSRISVGIEPPHVCSATVLMIITMVLINGLC